MFENLRRLQVVIKGGGMYVDSSTVRLKVMFIKACRCGASTVVDSVFFRGSDVSVIAF